ncbi:MAG TPA: HipA family kinase [Anaerolineales bacterium]|nr:HipA family kinase [Anaerolineales bacterium]
MPWKDNYYPSVPVVSPISVGKPKSTGRTQPLEMHCETANGPADYIVKLWGCPELPFGPHCLAREIYGALLADFFGLQTPEIAIVNIDPEFPISQPDLQIQSRLTQSTGSNFGSKYLQGAVIFSNPVLPNRKSDAARVFCFDLLIGNVDRRISKPNVFQTSDGFIVFDHESAFPFSKPATYLGGYPKPWDFVREPWHRDHAFFPSLKGADSALEIEEFVMILNMLSDEVFDKIEDITPEEWRTPDLQVLKDYLLSARDNSQVFKRSLQEILS